MISSSIAITVMADMMLPMTSAEPIRTEETSAVRESEAVRWMKVCRMRDECLRPRAPLLLEVQSTAENESATQNERSVSSEHCVSLSNSWADLGDTAARASPFRRAQCAPSRPPSGDAKGPSARRGCPYPPVHKMQGDQWSTLVLQAVA